MRLEKPRVRPLADSELHPDVRQRFGSEPLLNIFRTLAHHPGLMKRWLVFGSHVMAKSTLPAREREILILRVGWLCRCGYEWGQHVEIARASGLSEEEIARVPEGPDAPGWSEHERWLLRAADELRSDAFISDATWDGLASHYETQQLLDVIFTVGQYNLVSMALNSLGVQPEHADIPKLPGQ